MKKKQIGALIAASALTLTFAGTALAGTVSWNGKDKAPCESGYWVLNQIEGGVPPTLTVDGVQASLVKFVGNDKVAHYQSGPVTINSVADVSPVTGQLQLSHCAETTTTTTTTETESTETESTETESTETETTSTETTTETTSTETTTSTIETETTETTDSVESTTETTDSVESTTETTESVESETESKTPPATDALAGGDATVSGSLWALLVGAAGILAGVLLLTPKRIRNRR